MSTVGSGAAAASAPAVVEDTSSHWAPHGPVLTACVVAINVLMILLIFVFFWRYFTGKRGPSFASAGAGGDDDDASSSSSLPVASPWAWAASRRQRRSSKDDVASALPVYVYSSSAGAGAGEDGKKAPECAVCIVELRDGDSARLLPRCGHWFHADCVGAWVRLHATCPLCRASVVAPRAAAAANESRNAKDDGGGAGGADCPV